MAVLALTLGTGQARVVSSSVETGEYPLPESAAWLKRPSHAAMLEVRAAPHAPVEVSWRIHCRSGERNRVMRRRITTASFPARIRMPVLVARPHYCQLSADAAYRSFDQRGRIAVQISY